MLASQLRNGRIPVLNEMCRHDGAVEIPVLVGFAARIFQSAACLADGDGLASGVCFDADARRR